MRQILGEVATRLHDNYPYHHPLYAGQMLKPPHPVARAAYALAQTLNPNNHALDGGRASSALEKEAVADLAAMAGFDPHLGHLTSGGTFANLEALWIAGRERDGRTVLASEQAHYTHARISGVLRLPFESLPADRRGRLDVDALRDRLRRADVGTVVVTLGTTAVGAVDPLHEVVALRAEFDFRIHVDAAYGGYFTLVADLPDDVRRAYDALPQADSVCIDPHKHGLQPYGCGCVLFADPSVGRHYRHESPYTYFTSGDLHLGEISLECSRPGAAAVALWATHRLLPPVPGGAFAAMLARCRRAAAQWHGLLRQEDRFVTPLAPELDVLVWSLVGDDPSAANRRLFEAAAARDLHLALVRLPATLLAAAQPQTVLRSVLMKPEHLDWIDEMHRRLLAS